MNFHWISVTNGIYSLEHSMHSLLRLNEKTFNAIISQQRTFISVSPSGLSPCGRMCLPGLGSVRQPWWSLSRQCFPKAALCCCLSLCWCCCVSERAGECSNSVFPLAGWLLGDWPGGLPARALSRDSVFWGCSWSHCWRWEVCSVWKPKWNYWQPWGTITRKLFTNSVYG